MRVTCSGCKNEREVFANESRGCYEKRRPLCVACGHAKRISTLGGHAPNWKGGRHIDTKGYVRIHVPGIGYRKEHHIVWERHNGVRPDGFVIHHIDGNKENNSIENLECLDKIKHDQMNPGIIDAWKYRWGYLVNDKKYA